MDRINADLTRLECVMKDIQSSGSLFEVNVPEFKLLKQCRKELRMLKVFSCWLSKRLFHKKNVSSNSGIMSFWYAQASKTGSWLHGGKLMLKIWTLNARNSLRMFVYWIRKCVLGIRTSCWNQLWKICSPRYVLLGVWFWWYSVDVRILFLFFITELQNPAIRERHWIQLMASTKVSNENPCSYVQFVNKHLVTLTYRYRI